ncbi:MAG TPA: phosphoenolpyruvate carboxylase [Kofleriaceae bacterium]
MAHDPRGGKLDGDGTKDLADELLRDLGLLDQLLGDTVRGQSGDAALALVEGLEADALALRSGALAGGRGAFAARFAELDLGALHLVGRAFTLLFHLFNAAEEQHRIRILRRRDREGAPPDGSLAAACVELAAAGVSAEDMRGLLGRLFVMPVLTAHPTEARRRTVIELLAQVGGSLDRLDDPRAGAHERSGLVERLRQVVLVLYCTEQARSIRPSPVDEVRAALGVFESTLLDTTPLLYRALEDALAEAWPGEPFSVGPFLRWGTWIGGDRDGNPHVTAEVTRMALERQRQVAIGRLEADVDSLGRELAVSVRRSRPMPELEASLEADRVRLPDVAVRVRRRVAGELVGEKLWFVLARLQATRLRGEGGYADVAELRGDLDLVDASLRGAGLGLVAGGRLRDVRRRAEVFGFHLATMDLRQHSAVHERAVAELLKKGGVADYTVMTEEGRIALLGRLLERADLGAPRDRGALGPETRELLATFDVVGRARRDQGSEACERYVISFTAMPSDVLEVLFLARAARLAPDEIRPVPLFEQLEDLERAGATVRRLLDVRPFTTALRGELEAMIGYSDSSKQIGYVASQVALRRAQEQLAVVADEHGLILTVFHGRGGAVGRGGGPAGRAIRAQPHEALRGRLRVTEQGETIAARYGRREIAERDLEQMVGAVLLGSLLDQRPPPEPARRAREAALDRAAEAARDAYGALIGDQDRLARYALAATPIREVAELPIASRPASRKAGLSFDDLRAIPWVFSWNQSRHGIPGWFGLGTALAALADSPGLEAVRGLYAEWPAFQALIDNAQLALVRSDIDVAGQYAGLADPDARTLFDLVRAEHARTVERILEVTGGRALLDAFPTVRRSVERRNPYVDVLSHVQVELLRRMPGDPDPDRVREILFVTINGIAAGLQTAG